MMNQSIRAQNNQPKVTGYLHNQVDPPTNIKRSPQKRHAKLGRIDSSKYVKSIDRLQEVQPQGQVANDPRWQGAKEKP